MKLCGCKLLLLTAIFFNLSDSSKSSTADGAITHLLSPTIDVYAGRIGQRTALRCKAKYTADATIKWYKEASLKSCPKHNTGIMLGDTEYCSLNHSRLILRKNTVTSVLAFKYPRRQDSGIYMCMVLYSSNNITHKTLMNFHTKAAPPIRIIDSRDEILTDGIVEIFHNRAWLRVRFNSMKEWHVICNTLGDNFRPEPRSWQLIRPPRPYHIKTKEKTKDLSVRCQNMYNAFNKCELREDRVRTYTRYNWYMKRTDGPPAGKVTCTKLHLPDKVKDVSNLLRLSGFNRPDIGRVEIYHKGQWGFILPFVVHFNEADMICRMLGFKYGGEPIFDDSIQPIGGVFWIRNLDCPINASSLYDCKYTWEEEDRLYWDFGPKREVKCRKTPKEAPFIPFRMRLDRYGEEELYYYNDGWGTVCGAYIGTPEASMMCSMMGFKHGGHFKKSYMVYQHETRRILLRNLDCPLNSSDISQCQFRNNSLESPYRACRINSDSDFREVVTLICNKKPPKNKTVRLNGNRPNKGYLEVLHKGEWRIAQDLSPELVSVVCRQLGFRRGGEIYISNVAYEVINTLDENLEGKVALRKYDNHTLYQVSSILWDDINARAYCKSLGHRDGKPLLFNNQRRVTLSNNSTRYNNKQTILKMYCGRESKDLYDCFHSGWNEHWSGELDLTSLTSYKIAGVKCFK